MNKYKHTSYACYLGYITQALVITLPSLLFTVFFNKYGITLGELGFLITANFCVQIVVDLTSAIYMDKVNYRIPSVLAHLFSFSGFLLMSFLPDIMDEHRFFAICISSFIASVGGGLIEVIISPVMEILPNEKKAASMSFLHSFYCWGQGLTALLSTLYFVFFGIDKWNFLPLLWSVIPLFNMFYFMKVPIPEHKNERKEKNGYSLLKVKEFWIFLVIMISAGAAELAMSQWASFFAETALGVSKTAGDLLGLTMFAVFMGIARLFYGIKGGEIKLSDFIMWSGVLSVVSYIVVVFSPYPIISLIGCAVCGLSVGIMWPGTISYASEVFKGGASMFALLALAGDIGCSLGPGIVGFMSDLYRKGGIYFPLFTGDLTQQGLKFALMVAGIFPVLLVFAILFMRNKKDL